MCEICTYIKCIRTKDHALFFLILNLWRASFLWCSVKNYSFVALFLIVPRNMSTKFLWNILTFTQGIQLFTLITDISNSIFITISFRCNKLFLGEQYYYTQHCLVSVKRKLHLKHSVDNLKGTNNHNNNNGNMVLLSTRKLIVQEYACIYICMYATLFVWTPVWFTRCALLEWNDW